MELLILVMILIVALPEEWEIIPHHQADPVVFLAVVLVDLVVALVVALGIIVLVVLKLQAMLLDKVRIVERLPMAAAVVALRMRTRPSETK